MKQLFANNAATTLNGGITNLSTSITVADGSRFPNPGAYEYFLVTIELGSDIEICECTGRSGNILTISRRGVEGTTAKSFLSGARVECRVTRDTLDRTSKAFKSLASIDALVAPKDSYSEGYICETFDPSGQPTVVVRRNGDTWRYLNYTLVATRTSGASSTTTNLNLSSTIDLTDLAEAKYIMQIVSGPLTGYMRMVTSGTSTSLAWTTPLPSAPGAGITVEIHKSNASMLLDAGLTSLPDFEAMLNAKVDKVAGKGLSTNDYDNTEKALLATHTTQISSLSTSVTSINGSITTLTNNLNTTNNNVAIAGTVNVKRYLAGTHTWNKPAGLKQIRVTCVGVGGASSTAWPGADAIQYTSFTSAAISASASDGYNSSIAINPTYQRALGGSGSAVGNVGNAITINGSAGTYEVPGFSAIGGVWGMGGPNSLNQDTVFSGMYGGGGGYVQAIFNASSLASTGTVTVPNAEGDGGGGLVIIEEIF